MKISRLIDILEAHKLLEGDKDIAVITPEWGPCEVQVQYDDCYDLLIISDGKIL